jgi:hypothetical protein
MKQTLRISVRAHTQAHTQAHTHNPAKIHSF